jgi:Na+-transporting NADH:ubiquinone oxidoreductase subunit NqrB
MEYALGILVSLVILAIKKFFGGSLNTLGSLLALAVVSLLFGGLYTYFSATAYWDVMVKVIMASQTFYALVVKQFTSSS